MRPVKQIIVMRKDLNMRKGKMVAQGAHASMAALLNQGSYTQWDNDDELISHNFQVTLLDKPALRQWLTGAFAKVCVSVDSEQELLDIVSKAQAAGIPQALITDSGLTEFNGVPTKTCCGIGPWWSDEIDQITGHLKLL